jgi:hypothetical protein
MPSSSGESGSLHPIGIFAATAEGASTSEAATPAVIDLYQELQVEHEALSVGQKVKVKDVLESVERLERREQLLLPAFAHEFVAALWWMIQEGNEVRDYAAVRSAKTYVESKANPMLMREGVRLLLRMAEGAILARLNDPAAVAHKSEEAYRARSEEWEQQFAGQFIAIVQGEVIAHAVDKSELLREVAARQRATWPFRAYIVKVGAPPPPPVKGPTPRILSRKRAPGEPNEKP